MILPALGIISLNTAIIIKLSKIFSDSHNEALGKRQSTIQIDTPSDRNSVEMTEKTQTYLNPENVQSLNSDQRQNLVEHRVSFGRADSKTHQPRKMPPRVSSSVKTTRTLVVLSSVFVCLNLPSHALRVYMLIASLTKHNVPMQLYIVQEITHFIYYINFGSNFFLYSLCSRSFFKCAKEHIYSRFVRWLRHRHRNVNIPFTNLTVFTTPQTTSIYVSRDRDS